MKKNIILLMTAVFGVFVLAGCSEDDLKKTSAVLDSPTVENDFDRWLAKNYMEPYNIDFKYLFQRCSGRHGLQPDSRGYGQAIKLAKLTLHLTLQVYDEVTGNRRSSARTSRRSSMLSVRRPITKTTTSYSVWPKAVR